MTVKVGDRIAFIHSTDGGIGYMRKGDVGTVERIDAMKEGWFLGKVKWDNPKIRNIQYEYAKDWYVVLLSPDLPKTSKEKPVYEPPLKRMPTFTGKTTNDYM